MAPSAAGGRSIIEETDLAEGAYYYIVVTSTADTNGSDLDVHWTASQPLDAWIVDQANFEKYKSSSQFTSDLQQSGVAGVAVFNISEARKGDAPFYFVVDNSKLGPTAPQAGASVHLSISGQTRMAGFSTGSSTPNLAAEGAFQILSLTFVLIPTALLVVFLLMRRKKKARKAALREQIYAGTPPGPSSGSPAAPAIQAAPQPPPAAKPQFCRACGSPSAGATQFCRQCGAPL